jgi:WD40 repeat protein
VKVVLDAFDEARLLTFDRSPVTGQATVEVAHEALLREWPRMRGWLDAARQDLRLHSALVAEVAEWENSNRDSDYLLTGSRLVRYDDWRPTSGIELTESESAFLERSLDRRAEERTREDARRAAELRLERRSGQRLRALVVVVSVAALVAAGLTLVAVNRSRQTAASQREARARELINASRVNLPTDPELAILLALEAIDATRTTGGGVTRAAEETLHEAVNAHRLIQTAPGSVDVVYLPDGTVLSGGEGARLWNPVSGDELVLGLGELASVAASSDGSLVATGSGSGHLTVWDAATGDRLQEFTRGGRPAHDRFIRDLVFSSDGALLGSASGSVSGDQAVRVWDVATGTEVASVERPNGAMWNILTEAPQLAFHPEGAYLAITGFRDEAARILNIETGGWERSLIAPDSPARGVRYLADGDRIATSAAYGSIDIWDTATAGHLFSIPVGSADTKVLFLDASPDGTKLVAGSNDGIIRVWNLPDSQGLPSMELVAPDHVTGIAFGPDGNRLASVTSDRLQLWDITVGGRGEVAALDGEGSMTAFSPDGTRLAARRGGDIVILSTSTWEQVALLDHRGTFSAETGPIGLAWSPNGTRIITSVPDGEPLVGPGRIQLWNATTGALVQNLGEGWQPHGDIAFGSGGAVAAAMCQRSTDGASWESPAQVWDATSGKELFVVPIADCGAAVDVDPAGRLLAIQLEGRDEVQVWDIETGSRVGAVPHGPGSVGATRFSPDGSRLLTAGIDWTAKVWDMTTFEPLLTLEGHAGGITEAVWTPDGTTVVTGGADGTVRLWDADTGDVRLVLTGHRGPVRGLSVNPDGTRLASSGTDGVVRVWAIDLDDLIEIAESRLTRAPSRAECEAYRFDVCSGQT